LGGRRESRGAARAAELRASAIAAGHRDEAPPLAGYLSWVAKFEETIQLWQKAQGRFEKAFSSPRVAKLRSELKLLTSDEFEDVF
jgi:hypothetical protein